MKYIREMKRVGWERVVGVFRVANELDAIIIALLLYHDKDYAILVSDDVGMLLIVVLEKESEDV